MRPYWEHDVLGQAVLEESWIETVVATPGALTISMEAALPKDSSLWRDPPPDEWTCWRNAFLRFEQVEVIHWTDPSPPQSENDGTRNYDTFHLVEFEGDRYHLASEAGDIRLTAGSVTLTFEDDERPAAEERADS